MEKITKYILISLFLFVIVSILMFTSRIGLDLTSDIDQYAEKENKSKEDKEVSGNINCRELMVHCAHTDDCDEFQYYLDSGDCY